jgi:hypothetical protein
MGEATSPWNSLLDRETVLSLFRRVEGRLARAEGHPSVHIPVNKSEFPKLVCLDQNKWIELARVHYRKVTDLGAQRALDGIREAVFAGTIVVPIMTSNLIEAGEPNDEERRHRIASFMVEMSRNFSWSHPKTTDTQEAERSIRQHILEEREVAAVRPNLIRWGIDAATFGKVMKVDTDDRFLEVIAGQAMHEPEFSVLWLMHASDRTTVGNLRVFDVEGAAKIDGIRRSSGNATADRRRPHEMFHLLSSGSFAEKVHEILKRLQVPASVFETWLVDGGRLLQLTNDMPAVDVEFVLLAARDRNTQDRTHPNDFKDMMFLKQAIPYANIVVTENRWAHLANATGLAEKYGTRVIASLDDLPQALNEERCV